MKVRVYKDGYDWATTCREHELVVWCDSQEAAYEAAAGHVVMHHPSQRQRGATRRCESCHYLTWNLTGTCDRCNSA